MVRTNICRKEGREGEMFFFVKMSQIVTGIGLEAGAQPGNWCYNNLWYHFIIVLDGGSDGGGGGGAVEVVEVGTNLQSSAIHWEIVATIATATTDEIIVKTLPTLNLQVTDSPLNLKI